MNDLILNIDPVAKQRPIFSSFTRTARTPAKTRLFESQLKTLLTAQWKRPPLIGAIHMSIIFYLKPLKRINKNQPFPSVRPDLDNFIKAVKDAANGILYQDDGQVISLHAAKYYNYGKTNGQICISIWEMKENDY